MADLYGTNDRSSSFESEEMSSFLHNILHNSSPTPSPSSCTYFKAKHIHSFSSPPPPPPVPEESASAAGILFDSDFRLGDGASTALVDSSYSSDLYFSDTGGFFPTEAKERTGKSFSSAGAAPSDAITASTRSRKFSSDDDVDDFGFCEGALASEAPANSAPSRSSKRTRAAEIHNLSEKRRRSRINEKLKALQNLIPNSNKTDKASMLDEAIDYLKQLQLQVQMLTMRNGLSLHPVYLPEKPHPMQLPQRGVEYDDRNDLLNANRGNIFSGNQEIMTPTALQISTNITNSEASFGLEPSIQNHYGLLNHLTASKDICQIDSPSQLQLDINSSGKNSSSGVSKPR